MKKYGFLKNGLLGCISLVLIGCSSVVQTPTSSPAVPALYNAHAKAAVMVDDKAVYPIHCKPITTAFNNKGQLVVSNTSATNTTRLLLLSNFSKHKTLVDRFEKDPGAGAGWLSPISPKRWSALNINTKQFIITCNDQKGGTWNIRACQRVIRACWLPVSVQPHSDLLMGGFWVAENVPLSILFQTILSRGFSIR